MVVSSRLVSTGVIILKDMFNIEDFSVDMSIGSVLPVKHQYRLFIGFKEICAVLLEKLYLLTYSRNSVSFIEPEYLLLLTQKFFTIFYPKSDISCALPYALT
jgi:hypothetical protein